MNQNNSEIEEKKRHLLPLICAICIVFGIIVGYFLSNGNSGNLLPNSSATTMEVVINYINERYKDSVDVEELMEIGVGAIMKELDPHSMFIPTKDISGVTESIEGTFVGVGIEFYRVEDTVHVVRVMKNGPSETAGLKSGDKIISVNDSTIAGIGITNPGVISLLKGEEGSDVSVEIMRNGSEIKPFTIKRGQVDVSSIDAKYMANKTTGFIKLSSFTTKSGDEFTEALKDLKSQGAENLIIDLRQNGGGVLSSAETIVDHFISEGKMIVYTEGKATKRQDTKATKDGLFEKGRIAILVDEGSASASEIVAGAIQDWDRGAIIGRRTFGKGLVQEQYVLGDGSGLRLTVSEYFTPSGRNIQKPYDSDLQSYYNESYERYNNGEFSEEDSIKVIDSTKYYTGNGRVVYGGGGISPDIFVPIDSIYSNIQFINARVYVPGFAYSYYAKNIKNISQYEDYQSLITSINNQDLMMNFDTYLKKNDLSINDVKAKTASLNLIKAYVAREHFGESVFHQLINEQNLASSRALEFIQNNELLE